MEKQKGLSIILILLLVVLLGGLAFYFFVVKEQGAPKLKLGEFGREVFVKKTQEEDSMEEEKIFEPIVEDDKTPEEINNRVLNELDEIIISIDDDESLSDLEEY